MIRDWVHGMGHSPVFHILLQILCKALAILKGLISASTSVSSASSKVSGSNLPLIIAGRPRHKGSLSFSRSNLINPCGILYFHVAYF